MAQENELKSVELLVIYDTPSRKTPGSGLKFSVVQWYKPGGRISDKSESSVKWGVVSYWKDGEITKSKPKTLGAREFDELEKIDAQTGKSIYLTIKALVKNPPPIPVQADPNDAFGKPEEAPFS